MQKGENKCENSERGVNISLGIKGEVILFSEGDGGKHGFWTQ